MSITTTTIHPRLAYEPLTNRLATLDGYELLVATGGADGAPAWCHGAEAPLVAVGATPRELVTVDEDGRLARWDARTGDRYDTTQIGVPARGLAVAADGRTAVLAPGAVVLLFPGAQPSRVSLIDPVAAAFCGDGRHLAVVRGDGGAVLVDVDERAVSADFDVPGGARGVAWSASGGWMFTRAGGVGRAAASGGRCETFLEVDATGPVACSMDGRLVAYVSPRRVRVAQFPSGERVEHITYAQDVHDVAFGPGRWLAIALAGGDANLIDLDAGKAYRTDPHPGRPSRSWVFIMSSKILVARAASY